MDPRDRPMKMMAVDAALFESIGFCDATHSLFVKFRDSPPLCFEKVPRFRYQGLLTAPRKDVYFKTFIQNQFLSKATQLPL